MPVDASARAFDGLVIALALLALYVVLGQSTFYKVDGQALLELSNAGVVTHAYHTFYLALLRGLRALGEPLGVSVYRTACLLSALGTALGVLLMHRATAVLGHNRAVCNLVTLAFGLAPGVVFFASVVEVHGPFLPFAGLAALALARAARSLRWSWALLAGLGLALAYLAHPSGALMGALLPALAWSAANHAWPFRHVRWFALVTSCVLAAASAFATIAVMPTLLRQLAGLNVDPSVSSGFLMNFGTGKLLDPWLTVRTLGLEWLVPALPVSLVACVGVCVPRVRTGAILLMVGVLPYILAGQLMLAGYTERGAYALPTIWPTALVAMLLLAHRRRVALAVLAAAATFAIWQVKDHDRPERARSFVAGVTQIARGAPIFLVAGDEHDYAARAMYLPTTPQFFLGTIVGNSADTIRAALPKFDADVARMHDGGFVVLVTEAARRNLEIASETKQWTLSTDPLVRVAAPGAAPLLQHLLTTYRLTPVQAVGFSGYLLERREPK